MGQPTGDSDVLKTILVVEDDRVARSALEDIFDLLGYRSLLAQDGEEALRLYAEHAGTIDLVLSDLRMPKLDGIELARRLAALNPQVKVVLSTGYASEEQRQALAEVKIDGWIQKPYSLEQLTALLDQLLGA
ncbi:MAG: response regulator [Caldilineaceae bacterium]|nr:response regulator [Caldilineaceae bacterium]